MSENTSGKPRYVKTDHYYEGLAQYRIKGYGPDPSKLFPLNKEQEKEKRRLTQMESEKEKRWEEFLSKHSNEIQEAKSENKRLRSLASSFNKEYIKENGPRPPKDAGPPTATVYWRAEVRMQMAKKELDRCMSREGPNEYETCKPLLELYHDTIAFEQYCNQNNISPEKKWDTQIPVPSTPSPAKVAFDNWMNAYWAKFEDYRKKL